MKNNTITSIIFAIISILLLIGAAGWAIIYLALNPHFSEIPLYLTNPGPSLLVLLSGVTIIISYITKKKNLE